MDTDGEMNEWTNETFYAIYLLFLVYKIDCIII